MKILLTSFLLILAFQVCFGQEKAKAELVSDDTVYNCCDLQNRFYNFAEDIYKSEKTVGYIVIYNERNNLQKSLYYESVLLAILSRFNDNKKIFLIRGKTENIIRFEFWKVPQNAEFKISEAEWDFTMSKLQKSLNLSEFYAEALCGQKGIEKHFSERLSANPQLRGHLIINAKSKKNFRQKESTLIAELTNNYKIAKNQLKTFFVKNTEYDFVEFWLVPKRRKA